MPDHPLIIHSLASTTWLINNWDWLAAVVIVVGGLATFGLRDVERFSLKRTLAIAGVCFAESIRKRVLWITLLAIAGIVVITQLQKPVDEQDALRQTVKVAIFTTGIVVVMVSIILACTNLPKEIESRVIYTIVTKPTTRLEIVLGKVIGFSRVSLTVLAIMGLFTWGYLRVLERQKKAELVARIREGDISETERERLSHYLATGMLAGRTLRAPEQLQIYGRLPDVHSDKRIISNTGDEDAVAAFSADRSQLFGSEPASENPDEWAHQGIGRFGLIIRVRVSTKRTGPATDQPEGQSTMGPMLPSAPKAAKQVLPPAVQIELLATSGFYSLIDSQDMAAAANVEGLQQLIAAYVKTNHLNPAASAGDVRLSEPIHQSDGSDAQFAYAWIPPQSAIRLFNLSDFYVRLAGASDHVDYEISPDSIRAFVPQLMQGAIAFEPPGALDIPPTLGADGKPTPLLFRGRIGIHGDEEIHGGETHPAGIGVYSFRNVPVPGTPDGQIPFEINVQIDRQGADVEEGHDDATVLDVQVYDYTSGKMTPQTIQLESRQTTFFDLPPGSITGPDYDVMIACKSPGHIVGLYPDRSLQLVVSRESFELNLIKSLTILWMMSILVLSLAIFCSTFLSWPIAIILTIVLLLGRWGVNELADVAGPGLGRQIVNDFRFNDAPVAKVVSTSVDALSKGMHYFSRILPDTSTFDAISSIEQGIGISNEELLQSVEVLLGFGLPATVMAYLILRGKEVAP